jgi:predicted RNA-binding protein with PUA-like domain
MSKNYWLMKSEPDVYPWEKLLSDGKGGWDGVRNHQAAKNLRAMQLGDEALFYHSNLGLAAVGVMRVIKTAYPDSTDLSGKFVMVDVAPVRTLPNPVTLQMMKATPALATMAMLRQSRLSVSPVTAAEWQKILALSGERVIPTAQ